MILRQVVRSVALLLLPIAFASLIVWATAGSSSGTTSDPIFTSIWFYLAAHQIPLGIAGSLVGAKLTLLPLGALALVFLAIRSGVIRSVSAFEEDAKRIVTLTFALLYGAIVIAISLLLSLRDQVVSVKWYLAVPIALSISLLFSIIAAQLMPERSRAPWEIAIAWAFFALGALLLLATLVLIASLILHSSAVGNLTTVIGPGIFGGIALFAIQALYLPNMVVATLGYISGSGAHIGSESIIHPLVLKLDQLPAVPLLGALPRGTFPWALFGAIVVVALGFIIHQRLRVRFGDDISSAISLAAFFVISFLIGWSASGQLITDVLDEVGPSWWRFPLVLAGELALGMAISRLFLLAKQRLQERSERKLATESSQGSKEQA